jgi:hypothetical protein
MDKLTSKNVFSFTFGGTTRTVQFKTGGNYNSPSVYTAESNGSASLTGQFDGTTIEGTIDVAPDFLEIYNNIFIALKGGISGTGTHKAYFRANGKNGIIETSFDNVLITKSTMYEDADQGAKRDLMVSFTVNDASDSVIKFED